MNQIQEKYNWNLTDLFENKEDFYKAKEKMQKDLKIAYECGAFGAIVGSAITRPQLIAKNFVNVLKDIDIK